MPKVKIKKTFSVQAEALFVAVQDTLTHDKELKAFEPNFKIYDQNIDLDKIFVKLSGSRIQGHFLITPVKKGCTIDIELKLAFMLTPFKRLIQRKIEEKLELIS